MKKTIISVLLSFAAFASQAEPAAVPEAFIKQLVAGINSRDLSVLQDIIHPATRACMTPETKHYYAWWLWKDGSKPYTVAEHYELKPEKPLDVAAAERAIKTLPTALLHWPVQPDEAFRLNYKPAPMSIVERLFEITLKDGKALLVMDCPTKEGLEAFQKNRDEHLKEQRKLERIWSTMNPQDRQAFSLMAKQGLKLDGMKAAEQKYHLDINESLAFMDMVQYADTP